jgi:hypothetical protein
MFHNAADAKTYALAGHATITLTSKRTEARYTYRITQAKNRDTNEPQQMWFVGLLSGPNNETDYTYVGLIGSDGQFRLTAKSKLAADSKPVRGFNYFLKHVNAGQLPADLEVRHEGACGRCGRKLTVPESIDRGIGPECANQMGL